MIPRRAVAGWVTYDLANTIFALGVVGLYFPSFLHESGGRDSQLALTEAIAGGAVILLAPWLGGVSDRFGRRLPFLAVTTLIAVAATFTLASTDLDSSLVALAFALVGFNLGSALYDALLARVSTAENRSQVSGLGIAVGYVGSIIGLAIGRVTLDRGGYPLTFRTLAVAFALLSIPIFVWLREPKSPIAGAQNSFNRPGTIAAWRNASSHPGVVRFLLGRFLYTDAINTLIGGFLAIFVIAELGMTEDQVNTLLSVAILAAIGGGLLGGRAAHRFGARAALRVTLLVWVLALGLGMVAALSGVDAIVWPVGVLGGLALGATWASDRVLMYELSPPERLGEFYGLYATVGRFATIVGPLVWALVVDVFGWGRTAALGALALFIVAGWWTIRR